MDDKLSFRTPIWISKLGIPIIIIVSVLTALIMRLIQYPEVVTSSVTITQTKKNTDSEQNETLRAEIAVEFETAINIKPQGKANIKLYNFPYTTYGVLTGYIDSISLNYPTKKAKIFLLFPKNRTSFNFKLPSDHDLFGIAEIYSIDISIWDRLVIKYLD